MIRYRLFGRRARRALSIAAFGVGLLLAGVTALVIDASRSARPDVSGPVLPGWREAAGNASGIEVITPDTMFRLERGESGWTMPSRGHYPVRAEYLAELDAGLAALTYAGALTRDPGRYDRLGVGDPVEGGSGTRLTIVDGRDMLLASLIIGGARGGRALHTAHVRCPGPCRRGRLPDLSDPGRWLGLDFFNIDPSRIARAFIVPETGPAYILERDAPATRNFDLVSPRTATDHRRGGQRGGPCRHPRAVPRCRTGLCASWAAGCAAPGGDV